MGLNWYSYSLKWSRDWANIHYEVLFGCLFHFCFYRWLGALLSGRGGGRLFPVMAYTKGTPFQASGI